MTTKELVAKVREKAGELCQAEGLRLWDVTFEKEGRSYYLAVYIDRDDEGVFIEDCEKISRALDPYLDGKEFDSLPSYMLTVSSAGLERRISRPEHFDWAMGKDIDVSFYKAREGGMSICGKLTAKTDDTITIEQNGNLLELNMADVAMVKLHFEI